MISPENCLGCQVARSIAIPESEFVYADEFWTVNHILTPAPLLGWFFSSICTPPTLFYWEHILKYRAYIHAKIGQQIFFKEVFRGIYTKDEHVRGHARYAR